MVAALEETVIQGFICNAFLFDLALGPFMTVDTDANRKRSVGADFDEAGPEIGVIDVEIVLLHKHGLAGVLRDAGLWMLDAG